MEKPLQDVLEQVGLLINTGRFGEARRVIRRFARLKVARPLRANLDLLYGLSYLREGRWKQALSAFDRVVHGAEGAAELVASALNYIGDCFMQRGQCETARRYYLRSLQLCEQAGVGGEVLARNLADLAQLAAFSGDYSVAVGNWYRAVELYQASGDVTRLTAALLNIAVHTHRAGRKDEARTTLERCLNLLKSGARSPYLHSALAVRAGFVMGDGDYGGGLALLEEAVKEGEAWGRLEALGARWALALALLRVGLFERAKRALEEVGAEAARLGHRRILAFSRFALGRVRLLLGDAPAALRYFREARTMLHALSDTHSAASTALHEAALCLRTNRIPNARKLLLQTEPMARESEDIILRTTFSLLQAQLQVTLSATERMDTDRLTAVLRPLKDGFVPSYLELVAELVDFCISRGMDAEIRSLLGEVLPVLRRVADSLSGDLQAAFMAHPLTRTVLEAAVRVLPEGDRTPLAILDLLVSALAEPERAGHRRGRVAMPEAVWASAEMEQVMRLARDVAKTNLPVLLVGETGVGKEVVARFIHAESGLKGDFVALNCAAVPPTLIESELFGYEAGAFTGADRPKRGLFQAAHGGTLFLDEIGETPPEMQAKLLRALEEGRVRRLGSTNWEHIQVRLICATSTDLQEQLKRKRFRSDLYYRINAVTIKIPPLRQRKEDIPVLVKHFLSRAPRPVRITDEAMKALLAYQWPGNVRELKNEIARLLSLNQPVITKQMLKEEIKNPTTPQPATTLQEMEKRLIEEALRQSGYNKKKAAKMLGISRTTIYDKIKRYGIECSDS